MVIAPRYPERDFPAQVAARAPAQRLIVRQSPARGRDVRERQHFANRAKLFNFKGDICWNANDVTARLSLPPPCPYHTGGHLDPEGLALVNSWTPYIHRTVLEGTGDIGSPGRYEPDTHREQAAPPSRSRSPCSTMKTAVQMGSRSRLRQWAVLPLPPRLRAQPTPPPRLLARRSELPSLAPRPPTLRHRKRPPRQTVVRTRLSRCPARLTTAPTGRPAA